MITLQPTDQYQIAGGNVSFTAKGVGLYGVTYQWKTNGVNRAGATNATLSLTNVQAAQAGGYTVNVSNEVGSILSTNATLYLVTPPVITSQTPMPTNQVAIYGNYLTFAVTVTAPGQFNGYPLTYQWKFNGTNVGANANSYTLLGEQSSLGTYSVTVTNVMGSASAAWQVTNVTYTGSYVDVGTLAYHLATNAVGRTNGYTPANNMLEVSGWTYADYYPTNLHLLTNAVWSTNFWLKGAQGLSATPIGLLYGRGGQGLVTMVSPRHSLFASHVHTNETSFVAVFLDTNNVIHWRTNIQTVHLENDIAVGILNADLPASVGYLPVVPTNLSNYLPTNSTSVVQGTGMNQDLRIFSQPMTFGTPANVSWDSTNVIPFGLTTNWSIALRGGDSSAPERFLIGNQLVLVSHNFTKFGGPNYAFYFGTINAQLHYLSTNNNAGTDYQLTPFSLTNWPSIH